MIQAANIDVNATIVFTSSSCTSQRYSGMTSPEGCEVGIRCRENSRTFFCYFDLTNPLSRHMHIVAAHYFEVRDYIEAQRLRCRNGQWVDQIGRTIRITEGIFSARCRWGCPALTDLDMINATYVEGPPRGENQVVSSGKVSQHASLMPTIRLISVSTGHSFACRLERNIFSLKTATGIFGRTTPL